MRRFYIRHDDGTFGLDPMHEDMTEERDARDCEPTEDDLVGPATHQTIMLRDGQHVDALVSATGAMAIVDLPEVVLGG